MLTFRALALRRSEDIHALTYTSQTKRQMNVTVRNTDLPIVVEPVEAHINANENMLWLVKYKEFNRVIYSRAKGGCYVLTYDNCFIQLRCISADSYEMIFSSRNSKCF